MEIHKPTPWHGLREFLKEYLIIVIGVLTALAGEQVVETLTWRHRTAEAEAALRRELAVDLSYAVEQQALSPCANRYIDILQQAVAKNRPDVIQALFRIGAPTHPHPWRIDTWTAALNAQTPDHMAPERVQAYSLEARLVNSEEAQQWELTGLYAEPMAGRFGGMNDPAVAAQEQRLAERLRANEVRRADITGAFLQTSREVLGILPSTARAEEFRNAVTACEAKIKTIPPL